MAISMQVAAVVGFYMVAALVVNFFSKFEQNDRLIRSRWSL